MRFFYISYLFDNGHGSCIRFANDGMMFSRKHVIKSIENDANVKGVTIMSWQEMTFEEVAQFQDLTDEDKEIMNLKG